MPGFLVSNVSQKLTAVPNCMPQFPATGVEDPPPDPEPDPADAVQVAVAPPLVPAQLHVHGPEPTTDDAVPTEQRFVDGVDDDVVPFADPHKPLTGDWPLFTETVALATGEEPPLPVHVSMYVVVLAGDTTRVPLGAFVPVQPPAAVHAVESVEDQFMVDILPDAILVGFAENATVGAGVCEVATEATQVAVAPPLEPPQLHVQGPVPATDDTVPVEQRLDEGLDDTFVPFADPHTPLTGVGVAPITPSPFRS